MTRMLMLTLAVGAFLIVPARADDEIDAKTKEVLKKVGTLYKDAKSLRADLALEGKIEVEGQEAREVAAKGTVAMQRPNKFALRTSNKKDGNAGLEVVSDGQHLYVYAKRLKQYTEHKAPEKTPEIGRALLPLQFANTGMLFQNVLADDPTEALFEGVTEGKYAGKEKVNGKETHHLTFKQPNLDWELWVAAEGEPFVLKAKCVGDLPSGKITSVETYSNWKLNPEFEKDPFTFKAPEETKKVERLGAQRGDG